MKFKAIIFDFDGVLFDSEKIHLQACNAVFSTLGFNISEEEYAACVSLANPQTTAIPDSPLFLKIDGDERGIFRI